MNLLDYTAVKATRNDRSVRKLDGSDLCCFLFNLILSHVLNDKVAD